MDYLPLSNGGVVVVDDADYQFLSQYRWHANNHGYISGWVNGREQFMHRLLINAEPDIEVDHINGVRQDNRRNNLQKLPKAEHIKKPHLPYKKRKPGQQDRKVSASGYRGVYEVNKPPEAIQSDNHLWWQNLQPKEPFYGGRCRTRL